MYKYTGQDDITVGSPVANRNHQELENLIGFFANTIVLRSHLEQGTSFRDFLHQLKESSYEAYDYQDTPFELVVDRLVEERDLSRSPLFQVMFVLQNTPQTNRELEAHLLADAALTSNSTEEELSHYRTAKFDLTMTVTEQQNGLSLDIEYCTDLFKAGTINRLVGHYKQLLSGVVQDVHSPIAELEILSAAEQEELQNTFNTPLAEWEENSTILDLFEQQVAQNPAGIAVSHQDRVLSYQQLDEQSDALSGYLASVHQIDPGDFIGVKLERSEWVIIAILAIIKNRAAFVPVDPNYPQDRQDYIEKDSGCQLVIDEAFIATYREEISAPTAEHYTKPNRIIKPTDDLYVIYTSGSTGQPKGVLVSHRNLVASCSARMDYYKTGTRMLLVPSFSFDSSIAVVWGTLLMGGTLIIAKEAQLHDIDQMRVLMRKKKVESLLCVPSFYQLLLEQDVFVQNQLRNAIVAGESLSKNLIKKHYAHSPQTELFNEYGPTECTIWASVASIQPTDEVVTIGRAIPTVHFWILDQASQAVPVGVMGEVYLGGPQVAKGYLNQLELTQQKFVHKAIFEQATQRLYRTGDMARWLDDGRIEFLGRTDDQVKLRGYRVELGEINAVYEELEMVNQSLIIVHEQEPGEKHLIAYVVPGEDFNKEQVQNHVQARLPEFMVPAVLIELEAFPKTANGKIDKKALIQPDLSSLSAAAYVAPRNELEAQLAEIYANLLNKTTVGIQDNFFTIGGHSLLAMRAVAAIRKVCNLEISLKAFFEAPTIEALAKRLSTVGQQNLFPPISRHSDQVEDIPLSFAQERLWLLDKLGGSTHYHIPYIQHFSAELDVESLHSAFQEVINRHAILRTVYYEKNGTSYQSLLSENSFVLRLEKIQEGQDSRPLKELIAQEIECPFNLASDLMLRAKLFQLADQGYVLVLVMHHIASDAWSSTILINELFEIYAAKQQQQEVSLVDLPIQYQDYALWQRNYFTKAVLQEKLHFWEKQLQGLKPLNLPLDKKRPKLPSRAAGLTQLRLNADLANRLQAASVQEEVTLFTLLLTSFKVLLYKYTGQKDICVGSPVANRPLQELEGLIGFFLNALPFRSKLNGNPLFSDLLSQVQATVLEAYQHQVPFEELVNRVATSRNSQFSPVFQVWFDLHDNANLQQGRGQTKSEILRSTAHHPGDFASSKFDLEFIVNVEKGAIEIDIIYNAGLFKPDTIERLAGHYQQLLAEITSDTKRPIGALQLMGSAERQMLQVDFNATQRPMEAILALQKFAEQVALYPQKEALVYQGERCTYEELDLQSNKLANHLVQTMKINQGDLVGIMMDRSIWTIVSILGVLKSGAAYVPIDVDYPSDRKEFIVKDTNLKLLIVDSASMLDAMSYPVELFSIDIQMDDLPKNTAAPSVNISPSDLAYVIYTSGTTGRPKGVMISQGNFWNYINFSLHHYRQGNQAFNFPFFTSLSFDLTQTSIFLSLLSGGTLFIEQGENLIETFEDISANAAINSIKMTPSHIRLLEGLRSTSIELAILGGEALEKKHMEALKQYQPDIVVYNEYGPTEATVGSVVYKIEEVDRPILIGAPIWNTGIFVLDTDLNLCPLGVPGELYIGGAGLAKGYLNRPQLSSERFIPNPLADESYPILYKTGDWAKWHPEGVLTYLGRKDEQVKINGYRIELAEIEAVLMTADSVQDGVVTTKLDQKDQQCLVAYLVPKDTFNKEAIRQFLRQQLPAYMVPQWILSIDTIPLNINGKLDREALPDPDFELDAGRVLVAPRNETEATLVEIWKDLLDMEAVSTDDNFFELGGDSIISIQLVSRARKEGLNFIPKDIFEYQTIADLALIANNQDSKTEAEQDILEGLSSLSPIQHWFLNQQINNRSHFNQAQLFSIDKEVSSKQLQRVLTKLVEQHDALRFEFVFEEQEWIQRYGSPTDVFEVVNIEEKDKGKRAELISGICMQHQWALDIAKGELIKVVLMKNACRGSTKSLAGGHSSPCHRWCFLANFTGAPSDWHRSSAKGTRCGTRAQNHFLPTMGGCSTGIR